MKLGSQVRYKLPERMRDPYAKPARWRKGTIKSLSECGRYARVLKLTNVHLMVVANLEEMKPNGP